MNLKIKINLEKIHKKFDINFDDISDNLTRMENIRRNFSGRWTNLCEQSGAIILKNPKFTSVLQGMFWKLSSDYEDKEFYKDLTFNIDNKPFITPEDKIASDYEQKSSDLLSAFINFMEYYHNNKDDISLNATDFNKKLAIIKTNFTQKANRNKLIKDAQIKGNVLKENNNIIDVNIEKLLHGEQAMIKINEIIDDMNKSGANFIKMHLTEEKNNKEIKKIGEKARKDKLLQATEIVWEYSKEEKLKHYGDYMGIIQQNNINNQEATHIEHNNNNNNNNMVENNNNKDNDNNNNKITQDNNNNNNKNNKSVINQSNRIEALEEHYNPHDTSKFLNTSKLRHDNIEKLKGQKIKLAEIKLEIESTKTNINDYEKKIHDYEEKVSDLKNTDKKEIKQIVPIYQFTPISLQNHKLLLKKSNKTRDVGFRSIIHVPDLDYVVTGDNYGSISIYRIKGMKLIHFFENAHYGKIKCLVYLKDGKSFLSGGADKKIKKYSLISPFESDFIIGNESNEDNSNNLLKGSVCCIEYLNDGKTILASNGNNITKVDYVKKEVLESYDDCKNDITSMCLIHSNDNNNNSLLVTGDKNNKIIKYEYDSSVNKLTKLIDYNDPVNSNNSKAKIKDLKVIDAKKSKHFLDLMKINPIDDNKDNNEDNNNNKEKENIETRIVVTLTNFTENEKNDCYSVINVYHLKDLSLIKTIKNKTIFRRLIFLDDITNLSFIYPSKRGFFNIHNIENDTNKEKTSKQEEDKSNMLISINSNNVNVNKNQLLNEELEYLDGVYIGNGSSVYMVTNGGLIEEWIGN